jgi:hypothetical protein
MLCFTTTPLKILSSSEWYPAVISISFPGIRRSSLLSLKSCSGTLPSKITMRA